MQAAENEPAPREKTVGIVGLGAVGYAVCHGLSRYYRCVGYDLDEDYSWADLLGSDVVMVCVPTPAGDDGRLDCSAVGDVLRRLSQDRYEGVVVVKSTVRVGFMDQASAAYPGLRLVYMPEFLRERSRFSWFMNPDRLLLSGNAEDMDEVLAYFRWVSGPTVIRTNHASAELGKVAHNAFIATKVTFTNEIERVAVQCGADPSVVMSVVSADRRVRSDAHLRPGLGPYGGKCVPKDTSELAAIAGPEARLLCAARAGRSESDNEPVRRTDEIAVIIPTKNRPEKLRRALSSVARQVRQPNYVIIVSDCDPALEDETRKAGGELPGTIRVELLRNRRTPNLSGAVNTGLNRLTELACPTDTTFVALLDDDDWWGRFYLDNVATFAEETGVDWVVSGLVRHEDRLPPTRLEIPSILKIEDFLVTNPNVQGSNLYVRLSRLLGAGGFDEMLPSTTDRDICIRLLEQPGIRYEILRNHLVHHEASSDPTRLSAPGSLQKRAGLEAFYRKYVAMMTPEQRTKFRERAQTVFHIEIQAGG